jgi:hypothetical protein
VSPETKYKTYEKKTVDLTGNGTKARDTSGKDNNESLFQ